jgi:hypothetical protein
MNIRLVKPVRIEGPLRQNSVIELVTIRPPLVRDIIGLDFFGAAAIGSMATLLERCSNLTRDQVLALEPADFSTLTGEIAKFLERRPG